MTIMTKPFEALPGTTPVLLIHADGCRWPVGEAHPMLFCNAAVDRSCGHPYCQPHGKLSYPAAKVTTKGNAKGYR